MLASAGSQARSSSSQVDTPQPASRSTSLSARIKMFEQQAAAAAQGVRLQQAPVGQVVAGL